MLGREGAQHLGQHALIVLDSVRFVEDEVVVLQLSHGSLLSYHHLERGEEHIELTFLHLILLHELFLLFASEAIKHEDSTVWEPFVELFLPLFQGDLGYDHEVVGTTAQALFLRQQGLDLSQYADALDGFS